MLRKIGFHYHGSTLETGHLKPRNDHTLSVERSEQTPRANSEPSGARHGDHWRQTSKANHTYPSDKSQDVSPFGSQHHDLLGLHLVYDNANPDGDIIFVHGLGGTATKTWSWNRNVDYFWPAWLADEIELSSYRIFTFGYNSDFRGASTNLNIVDFAKDLLFQMLTFSGGLGEHQVRIGRQAILFVAHSMGGLVVKKAYVLGKHDQEYASIISQVYGIVFLATPHRGAHYAKILNNILSTTPLGTSPKAYVADLDTHSTALQDINEQFRTSCEDLALFSFFETLKTNFGLTKALIVEKESGVLGYPQESSSPMNADHHTICKFESRDDANYVNVRNILKLWALRIRPIRPNSQMKGRISNHALIKEIETITGILESAEDEINPIRNRVMPGTCIWITQRQDFVQWSERASSPENPRIFWLIGLPATGKTILASVVVDYLQFLREDCQYHFFSSSHQTKRTAAYCLRSIVSQLALINGEFRKKLLSLHEETGIAFTSQNQSFHVIWEKIFEGIIFKMRFQKTLFWVLDAVDEADSQSLILSHLMKIESLTPIKLFLTSRPLKIPSASAIYGSSIVTCFLSENDTIEDIRTYVQNVVRDALPDDEKIQEDIIDQVLTKASGSFLWVKLVLETLQDNWHTQDDIRKVLTEVPRGMEHLYERMLGMIKAQSPRLQLMASRILTWAACCWRPLSIAELQVALESEFGSFVRLADTIVQICGHFISVENSKITLIHVTARHFLLSDRDGAPAFIESRSGHELVALNCLKHLSTDTWRRVFKVVENSNYSIDRKSRINRLLLAEKDHPFLGYATCYWAYHVSKSPVDSQNLLVSLHDFFARYCLSWLQAIALSSNLRYLTRSAQYLKTFTKRISRKSRRISFSSPLSLTDPSENDTSYIQLWAIDFIRIVGKFGPNLVQSPSSVYRLVPAFCPSGSMIGRTYGAANDKIISVTGSPSARWDDCLASVRVGNDETASKVLATDAFFITLISTGGTIVIWYAETCEEARRINHNEYVRLINLNKSQTLLATAGLQTYRIWDISSGKELYCLQKTAQALTMVICFGNTDTSLVVGLDDCSITCYDLETSQKLWCFVAQDPSGESQGCPRIMALSPNLRKVAIAWRGKPLLVWDMITNQLQHPERCRVKDNTDALCAPERIEWQADGNSILILCQSTKLVEWHFYDEEQVEFDHVKPCEMTISRDGNFLLTSDNVGTISVWIFPRLHLIYQLVNENEFIRGLAFSPDSQRFYDTRESMCNVWEPEALVRPDEQDLEDQSSVGDSSIVTEPIISHDESTQNQITTLAVDADDKYYCCGRQDGTVTIHGAIDGRKIRKVHSHASISTVIVLTWSHSGRYMVSGDDSGRIIAKRLEVKEVDKWAVYPVFDFRLGEPVQQFLFNSTEKLLLISTSSADHVWNLKEKKEICLQRWSSRQSRRWIEHPLNAKLLIWIDPVEVHTYTWMTLEHSDPVQTLVTEPIRPAQLSCRTQLPVVTGEHEKLVQWIALTKDKRYLVYETLPNAGHSSTRPSGEVHLEFLSISDLRGQHPHSLANECMADLAGQVKRLIGTYQDTIVFLDHDFWLCTWKIDAGVYDVTRHFFLPKDWLNISTLQMAVLNAQGTFFCPKRGGVAIVRHGMRF